MNLIYGLALGIGIVAGLRAMTAPAALSWAACLGWLDLHGTALSFMGSGIAVTIFTTLAVVEYITDLLPSTPNRTAAGPLLVRVLTGALSGACLSESAGLGLSGGAIAGGVGAVIGALGGYEIRRRLVRRLGVKDALIAVPEDLVAIALALLLVRP